MRHIMEAGAALMLLLMSATMAGTTTAQSFYGDSIRVLRPVKEADGTYTVSFYHRQNDRSSCQGQSSFTCDKGVCKRFKKLGVWQMVTDNSGQGRWCQSEQQQHTTTTVSNNQTSFSLRGSGCCWASNVNGKTNWTTHAELNLGIRSDSQALNSCPVTASVASLRVPQNCFSGLRLLAHDPDGDNVRCRFSSEATVPSNFTLDQADCMLTSTGQVEVGAQVFEVLMGDFPSKNISLSYMDGTKEFRDSSNTSSPLCTVKLQFLMEILPPIPNCEVGHVVPMFLSKTPSQGEVLHATVGQPFQFHAVAQSHHTSITDFQVSGPHNMSKVFVDSQHGKADLTVTWTPQLSDLYTFVPFCLTAETNTTQSEMRCVVVSTTQASIVQGKATVECSPNKMKVALDKASMPDIDVNYLKLSDPSCSLTSNSTHIMGTMSFSTCGTKVEDKGDFIAFQNEIHSFELPNEIITRRRMVKIDFSCQFPKAFSISSYYKIHKSDYIFTESSFGSFGYSFEIFTDSNFTNAVEASAYPVEVKLLQMIYMGIQAESELPNVKLFVESCKATPDENPDNSRFYDIIKNGCLEDETTKIHPSNQTSFNFEVQAFKFTGNFDQVYITCSVMLCEVSSPFSRCAQGCLKDASRRRRRGLRRETVSHYITQGPLQFVGQPVPNAAVDDDDVMRKTDEMENNNKPPAAVVPATPPPISPDTKSSEEGWEIRQILNTNISTIFFASTFLAMVVSLVVAVRYLRKKRGEDRKSLVASAWDD